MNNLPFTKEAAGNSCPRQDSPVCGSCITGAVGSQPSAGTQTDNCPGSASASFTPCPVYNIDQDAIGSDPVDQM